MKNTVLPLLLSVPLLSFPVRAADWPQYRGAAGNGISSEMMQWKASGLRTVWKVPSLGGFSSFVVADGRAFTLALREIEGASQEVLVAHDASSGRELWSAALQVAKYDKGGNDGTAENKGGDGPRSTPVLVGKNVVVMSSELALRCFEAATGKEVWTLDLKAQHAGRNIQWQNAASPLLEGGLIYVAGGGPGESLLAVSPENGRVVWKAFDEKMTHATPVAATILGQRQVIFFVQSGLLAVEPKSGKELWRYSFPYKVSTAASPVVGGDIVYCSAGYGVGAGAVKLTLESGAFKATELFRVPGNTPLANHWSTPVYKDGFLYGMFQFKEYGKGPVKCVELATGEVKWTKEGFGPGHVILIGNEVCALSDAGEIVRFEADSREYKELGRQKVLDGKCWTTPTVSGGRLFVRSTQEAACLE
ncbi:MAG: alcohol dehydrogenase [Verrucomicrobia bacterium]|nr:alcohol dehydrogenase [Verrucomicrobiota bacterium]